MDFNAEYEMIHTAYKEAMSHIENDNDGGVATDDDWEYLEALFYDACTLLLNSIEFDCYSRYGSVFPYKTNVRIEWKSGAISESWGSSHTSYFEAVYQAVWQFLF